VIDYPLGDPTRRAEALPRLEEKFHALTRHRWAAARQQALLRLFAEPDRLAAMAVPEFMDLLVEPS